MSISVAQAFGEGKPERATEEENQGGSGTGEKLERSKMVGVREGRAAHLRRTRGSARYSAWKKEKCTLSGRGGRKDNEENSTTYFTRTWVASVKSDGLCLLAAENNAERETGTEPCDPVSGNRREREK